MSALDRLPAQGREACRELAAATGWPAVQYAKAVKLLQKEGLFPDVGLADVARISRLSGVGPLGAAVTLCDQARKIREEDREQGGLPLDELIRNGG